MAKNNGKRIKMQKCKGVDVYEISLPVSKDVPLQELRGAPLPRRKSWWPYLLVLSVLVGAGIFLYAVHGSYTVDWQQVCTWLGMGVKEEIVAPPTTLPPVIGAGDSSALVELGPAAPPTPEIVEPVPPEDAGLVEDLGPEFVTVEGDYFDDAVFIGDSRTEGLRIYTSLKNPRYLSATGLMVDTVFTKKILPFGEKEKTTVVDAFRTQQYGKVYIMLGINELGWVQNGRFVRLYGQLIDEIRSLQNDPIIYIQALIPVTKSRSDKDEIFNNERIASYNVKLQALAQEKDVIFLNVGEAVVDESGALPEEASKDGIHMTPSYYKKWLAYLKTHAVLPAEVEINVPEGVYP